MSISIPFEIEKICPECNKAFVQKELVYIKKFCSNDCRYARVRREGWNTSTQFKKGYVQGKNENNPNWKGEKAGKLAIHGWLRRHYGRPMQCEACKTTSAKRYDWANISGEYKRNRNDFKRLCRSCHVKMDRNWLKKEQSHYSLSQPTVRTTCRKCLKDFLARGNGRRYCSKICMYHRSAL